MKLLKLSLFVFLLSYSFLAKAGEKPVILKVEARKIASETWRVLDKQRDTYYHMCEVVLKGIHTGERISWLTTPGYLGEDDPSYEPCILLIPGDNVKFLFLEKPYGGNATQLSGNASYKLVLFECEIPLSIGVFFMGENRYRLVP